MRKKQQRPRKLRKCEKGIKTKSTNRGCRYSKGADGVLRPRIGRN